MLNQPVYGYYTFDSNDEGQPLGFGYVYNLVKFGVVVGPKAFPGGPAVAIGGDTGTIYQHTEDDSSELGSADDDYSVTMNFPTWVAQIHYYSQTSRSKSDQCSRRGRVTHDEVGKRHSERRHTAYQMLRQGTLSIENESVRPVAEWMVEHVSQIEHLGPLLIRELWREKVLQAEDLSDLSSLMPGVEVFDCAPLARELGEAQSHDVVEVTVHARKGQIVGLLLEDGEGVDSRTVQVEIEGGESYRRGLRLEELLQCVGDEADVQLRTFETRAQLVHIHAVLGRTIQVREIAKIGGRRQPPAGIEAVDVDLNPALRFRSLRGAFERDKPVTPGDAKFDDGYPFDAQRPRKMCRLEDTPRVLWIQPPVL